ncbi:FkbM family methyltransferase [Pelagibacterium sp. H642]|uniref:FkbM family methyltransferase n=1 Tax=Pelagibacterium sp. H642 TaxID=1881069 RepID=UPI002814DD4A|nr:FkbM family methyltransferase [Pelagibacterium sp. H642]WMT92618.1 FkbM family methyltransferase [Pelagibacterium sp. H642]
MNEDHTVSFEAAGKMLSLSFASRADHIAHMIEQTGTFYEAEMLTDARSRLFYPKCVVDVGAHVGNHTLYFAHMLGVRTLSFEPNPATFRHLVANVSNNGLQKLCTVRNAAVGAMRGRANAEEASAKNSGMATVKLDAEGAIEVVSLDDELIGETDIDLVKIDVEGWELDVLRGSLSILQHHRPLLYIEVLEGEFDAVRSFLGAANYRCWKRFNITPTFLFLPLERLGA